MLNPPAPQALLLQIGDAADRVGLSLRTIRHWESVGLVTPQRTSGGLRLYTETDIERLLVLKRMKPLDLSLGAMAELIGLLDAVAVDGADARALDELAVFQDRAGAAIVKHELYVEQARELRDLIAEGRGSA
ncbi:MAG TPA: MerR family transcriptional regulator [Gaiellaceae bacterium]|jgi:DNA-binding transcriptional MerR regulator|nr:MerR family transcriptional regulator [Gaiellaceae bacterium]